MAEELAVAALEERTVVELEVETQLVDGDQLFRVGTVRTPAQTSYSTLPACLLATAGTKLILK